MEDLSYRVIRRLALGATILVLLPYLYVLVSGIYLWISVGPSWFFRDFAAYPPLPIVTCMIAPLVALPMILQYYSFFTKSWTPCFVISGFSFIVLIRILFLFIPHLLAATGVQNYPWVETAVYSVLTFFFAYIAIVMYLWGTELKRLEK